MDQTEQGEEVVFEAALRLPADQRAAYLDKTCVGDADLRRRVEVLLGAFERAGGFLKQPAVSTPARTLAVSLPPTEKPGDRIGRYKLLEQIGEGGCGVVYVAEQEEPVRRRVALKVIKLGMDTKQVIARFDAERQALAMMDHPNIAKIFDAGVTGSSDSQLSTPNSQLPQGRPYFVMELVRGTKITDYCDQNRLAPRERLDLFTQVCRAIQHAHQKGIIHRDIKPSNILVTLHDGVPVPKVIDFGIAKATQGRLTDQTVYTAFEQFIGTPAYMSPEQAEMSALDIDTRSDIYSLGVLLYELLTGKTPFDAKELLAAGLDEMRRTIREVEPVKPSKVVERESELRVERARARGVADSTLNSQLKSLSTDLDWIVMKCLEKDRTRRYETASGLATDISRHLNSEPIAARPPSAGYRFQKLVRRNKLAFSAMTAVVVALVIGLGIAAWQFVEKSKAYNRATAAEKRAEENAANEARQRKEAVEARKNETQLRQKAEAKELEVRHYAYASDMALVQQTLEVNALSRARELLDRYRPQPGQNTNDDLRGWEWRYLWQFCKDDEAVPLCKRNSISSISFSSDGALLAVGAIEGELTVWNTVTRKMVFREASTNAFPRKVTFSPARGLLAYNTQSGFALWDSDTQKQVRLLETGGYVRDLEFCKDGRLFTATTRRQNGVTLWDAESGVAITNFPAVISEFDFGNAFNIAADGRTFAHVTESHNVRVVQIESCDEWIIPVTEEMVTGLAFSSDGKMLATGSAFTDGTIKLWDVATRKLTGSLEGHTAYVRHLKFLPDGKTLASAGEDHTIRLWDLEKRRPVQFLRGHVASASYLDVSPEGRWVASGGVGGSVFLWDTTAKNTQPPPYRTLTNGAVQGWAFSPDNRFIGAVQNGRLKLYDVATLQPSTGPAFPATYISGFAFSPDMRLVVATDPEGHLMAWDIEGQRMRTNFVAHPGGAWLFFSHGGQRLLSLSPSRVVKEWDVASWREIRQWEISPDVTFDFTGIFLPTEDLIVIGGGGVIELIKVSDPAIRRRFASQHYLGKIALSSDGRTLAALGRTGGGSVGLWDLATEKQIALFGLSKNANGLDSVAFFPYGHRLIAGSDGKQAIIICDLSTLQTVATLDGKSSSFNRIAISPDGQTIAGQDLYGALHLWRAPTWAEIDAADKTNVAFSVIDADTVWPLYNQASALRDQGKLAEAEAKYHQTLVAMKSAFGPEDRGIPVTLNTLANLLAKHGRLPEAVNLHREAAEVARKLPPGKDRDELLNWSLRDLSTVLIQQGKVDELEAPYREDLNNTRKSWPENPAKWEGSLARLVDVLLRKGNYSDAENLLSNVLTPDVLKLPQSTGLLLVRAHFSARRGLWSEAIRDETKSLERDKDNHWTWFELAPLLVTSGDVAGYRRHCEMMLARFGATNNPAMARQTIKACSLLSVTEPALTTIASLADNALTQTSDWREFAKGFAEYRQGRWSNAVDWMTKALAKAPLDRRDAQASLILAMAHDQLKHADEARAALAKGAEIADTKIPKLDSGDLGPDWHDVLITHILMREARTLIEGKPATAAEKKTESR